MNRAAVLIGVRKAHHLPELQAVSDGVIQMKEWMLSQGIPEHRVRVITDETAKVTPQLIKDAVNELLAPGDLDQLIIYFAGHGVNVQYSEYWLLSDAILDSDAAVNVKASEERARYNGVPHVVFISDACRTAADGIQVQGILGSTIFRNQVASGPEKEIDLFFATLIGDPSLEIKSPKEAADGFKAIYTETLLEALRGQHPEIAEVDEQTGQRVVRPRPLKKFLAKELPIRVFQATSGPNPRSQQPDARVTSGDEALLSVLPAMTAGMPQAFGSPPSSAALEHSILTQRAIGRSDQATRSILESANNDMVVALTKIPASEPVKRTDLDMFSVANRRFKENAFRHATPFGPMRMETKCGFKIRGTRVIACEGYQVSFDIRDEGTLVRTELANHSARSVLLIFHDGTGMLLPAISGFLTSVTVEEGQVVDVAFEPSDNTERWQSYNERSDELRQLRAVISAATRNGTFRLEGDDAETLARRMQYARSIDPSLALYAVHAFRDQGHRARIREMAEFMQGDLGICLFDIALLAGKLGDRLDEPQRNFVFPFLPMLSQSWSLLPAYDVVLAVPLKQIAQCVLPNSLWTLFYKKGVLLISQVLQEGTVR
ncbi:MAG: caspase family protein [Pirellula sp.]